MSRRVTSCHVMSRHITSCHIMSSCHVISRLVTSCHATSCHVMSCRVTCDTYTCHVTAYHVLSYHVIMSRIFLPSLLNSSMMAAGGPDEVFETVALCGNPARSDALAVAPRALRACACGAVDVRCSQHVVREPSSHTHTLFGTRRVQLSVLEIMN